MDMEVLDINIGKRLCFKYYQLKDNLEVDKLLEKSFATFNDWLCSL